MAFVNIFIAQSQNFNSKVIKKEQLKSHTVEFLVNLNALKDIYAFADIFLSGELVVVDDGGSSVSLSIARSESM